jgi:hypothetical protein
MSGLNFLVFAIIAYLIYGSQPPIGASADALLAFYEGDHTRIFIAAVFSGMAVLNLMWFVAALRTVLASTGQDGWGSALTTSSAVVGALLLLLIAMSAAVAYSVARVGNASALPGLNGFVWASLVLTSFPRAMLIMAGTFGFWRAGLISNRAFVAGVAVVVLVLLGGTTWLSDGFWAPDGVYSRLLSPAIGFLWVVAASGILLVRSPTTGNGW